MQGTELYAAIIKAAIDLHESEFHPLECYLNAKDGRAFWVNSVDDLGLVVVPVGLGEDADVNTRGIAFEEIEDADLRALLAMMQAPPATDKSFHLAANLI